MRLCTQRLPNILLPLSWMLSPHLLRPFPFLLLPYHLFLLLMNVARLLFRPLLMTYSQILLLLLLLLLLLPLSGLKQQESLYLLGLCYNIPTR